MKSQGISEQKPPTPMATGPPREVETFDTGPRVLVVKREVAICLAGEYYSKSAENRPEIEFLELNNESVR